MNDAYDPENSYSNPKGPDLERPKEWDAEHGAPSNHLYDTDKETADKERGKPESNRQPNKAESDEQQATNENGTTADDQVGKGFSGGEARGKSPKRNGFSSFGLGSDKSKYVMGAGAASLLLVLFIGLLLSMTMPISAIRSAGTGLVTGYMGAQIVAGKVHLGNYWDGNIAKGVRQQCLGTTCELVSEKPKTKLDKYLIKRQTQLLNGLDAQGIRMLTDGAGSYKGLSIMPTESNQFSGIETADDLKKFVEKNYGAKKISITVVEEPMILPDGQRIGGVYDVVELSKTKWGQSKLFNGVLSESGAVETISSKITLRRLTPELDLGFHPLRELQRKVTDIETNKTEKALAWLEEFYKKTSGTASAQEITVSASQEEGGAVEPAGTAKLNESELVKAFRKMRSSTNDFLQSPGGKVTGGAMMVVGGVCMVNAFVNAQNITGIQNFVQPSQRVANYLTSMSDQVVALKEPDIDPESIDAAMLLLNRRDEKTGKITDFGDSSTWYAINAKTGGAPLSDAHAITAGRTDNEASKNVENTFNQVSGVVLNELCSGFTGLALTVGGVALGVLSGGVLTTLGGAAIGMGLFLSAEAMGSLAAGAPLDIKSLGPDQLYNVAGEGAFNLDRTKAWVSGGDPQSSEDHGALSRQYIVAEQSNFSNQSVAYKLFNIYDSKSVANKVALNGGASLSDTFSRMASSFTNIGNTLKNTFGTIVTSRASASAAQFDPCALNKRGCIGQSQAVLTNDGSAAIAVLEGPEGGKYTSLMKTCRDVEYVKDPEGLWTITIVSGMPAYSQFLVGQLPAECNNLANDKNWVALQAYNHLEPLLAAQVCMAADSKTADATDKEACAAIGYGQNSAGYQAASLSSGGQGGAFDSKAWMNSHSNGDIPLADMKKVSHQCVSKMSEPYMQPNAADALEAFNAAFKQQYKQDMYFQSCYRDLDGQQYAKDKYGSGAATVGKSNHGWGLAVDLGPNSGKLRGCDFTVVPGRPNLTSEEKQMCNWMIDNSSRFGFKPWTVPSEMWHFKYVGAASET